MGKRTLEAVDVTESTTKALDELVARHKASGMSADDLRLGMETILLAQSTGIAVIQVSTIEDGFDRLAHAIGAGTNLITDALDEIAQVMMTERRIEQVTTDEDGRPTSWRMRSLATDSIDDQEIERMRQWREIERLKAKIALLERTPSKEDGA